MKNVARKINVGMNCIFSGFLLKNIKLQPMHLILETHIHDRIMDENWLSITMIFKQDSSVLKDASQPINV